MPGKRGGGITNPLLDPRTDGHGESGGGIVEEEGDYVGGVSKSANCPNYLPHSGRRGQSKGIFHALIKI